MEMVTQRKVKREIVLATAPDVALGSLLGLHVCEGEDFQIVLRLLGEGPPEEGERGSPFLDKREDGDVQLPIVPPPGSFFVEDEGKEGLFVLEGVQTRDVQGPDDEQTWTRAPALQVVADVLGLAMEDPPSVAQLEQLTGADLEEIITWAGRVHAAASDNDDVVPGPAPRALRELLPQAHYLQTWGQNRVYEAIAAAAHLVNRAWCIAHGDLSQPFWRNAPDWQRDSAIAGVRGAIENPDPRASHEGWMAQKEADGWTYGETKDPERKTHPCMVPYDDLPFAQRAKDKLFVSTVLDLCRVFSIPTAVVDDHDALIEGAGEPPGDAERDIVQGPPAAGAPPHYRDVAISAMAAAGWEAERAHHRHSGPRFDSAGRDERASAVGRVRELLAGKSHAGPAPFARAALQVGAILGLTPKGDAS